MAKKKNGWMKRERNRAEAAAEEEPEAKPKVKMPGGRDVVSEFCPKCNKPKDKRRGILGDYANPYKCAFADCPLKDPFEPKDAEGRMKIKIGDRIQYAPRGPFQIKNGKVKSVRRSAGIKKKNEAWLESQEAKKNKGEANDDSKEEDGKEAQTESRSNS